MTARTVRPTIAELEAAGRAIFDQVEIALAERRREHARERATLANKLEAIAKHLAFMPDEHTIETARGALETIVRELRT